MMLQVLSQHIIAAPTNYAACLEKRKMLDGERMLTANTSGIDITCFTAEVATFIARMPLYRMAEKDAIANTSLHLYHS
jgi:hypothetical protein